MSPLALFFLLAANVLGGSSYVATAYGLRGFSPAELALWRQALSAILFLPFLSPAAVFRLERRDWAAIFGVGLFGLAAPLIIGNTGQRLSSAVNASLLVCFEPISIIVLSSLFLGETMTFLKSAAIAAGVGGSALIVLQGFSLKVTPHLAGDLLLFLHAVCWSLYTVIGKSALRRVPAGVFTALTTLVSLPALAVAAKLSPAAAAARPPEALAALAFLTVGVSFFGTLSWNRALALVPASQLASFIFLQPVVGVVLGVLLQKDAFTLWSAAGGALIVSGVYIASREEVPA